MSQRKDYFEYARRGLKNRGVEPSRQNLVKWFGHQPPETRAQILTNMPAESDHDLALDTQDLDDVLETRRTVSETNKVHAALMRQRR